MSPAVLAPFSSTQIHYAYNPGKTDELLQGFLGIMDLVGSTNGTLTKAQLDEYQGTSFLVPEPNRDVANYLNRNYAFIAPLDGDGSSISVKDLVHKNEGLPHPDATSDQTSLGQAINALFRIRSNMIASQFMPQITQSVLGRFLPELFGGGIFGMIQNRPPVYNMPVNIFTMPTQNIGLSGGGAALFPGVGHMPMLMHRMPSAPINYAGLNPLAGRMPAYAYPNINVNARTFNTGFLGESAGLSRNPFGGFSNQLSGMLPGIFVG